jgi:hypothetical protein
VRGLREYLCALLLLTPRRSSDIYTSTSKLGENEERIGTWFASSGKRDSVFLCTKVRCLL